MDESAPAPQKKPEPPVAAKPAKKQATGTTWGRKLLTAGFVLALLGGLGYAGWQLYTQRLEIDQLAQSQRELAARRDADSSTTRTLENQLSTLKTTLDAAREQLQAQEALLNQQRAELQRVSDELISASLRQTEQASGVPLAWRLEEVQSLLRLAQQHLQLGSGKATAIALMVSADEILAGIDDGAVFPVRSAIASDLSQVRAMPEIDLEGIYLRLASLSDSVNSLAVKNNLRDQLAAGTELGSGDSAWRQALRSLVSVRRIDGPLDPLLSPEQAFTLKSRVQLLIEQAQQAARAQNRGVYQSALAQAADLVSRYFEESNASTGVINGLGDMQAEPVATPVPAANAGLAAARQVLAAYRRGQGMAPESAP